MIYTVVKASPLARRIAQEHGLDLVAIRGTGPGGRVVRHDVEKELLSQELVKPFSPYDTVWATAWENKTLPLHPPAQVGFSVVADFLIGKQGCRDRFLKMLVRVGDSETDSKRT